MKQSYLSKSRMQYISSEIEGLYCVGNKDVCNHYESDGAKRIPWGKKPIYSDFNLIKRLHIIPSGEQVKASMIPSYVNNLSNLRFLRIPFPYLLNLNQESIPSNLTSLMIENSYEYEKQLDIKNIEWPDITLPFLKALLFIGDYDPSTIWYKLNISNKEIPTVEYLKTFIDKRGLILSEISKLSTLKLLEIEMVYNHDIFSEINSPLIGLDISTANSKFPISNLANIKSLQMIRLKNIKSEIDCEIFLNLSELREIEILNSKKILNISMLLKCKKLNSVSLINCGNPLKKEGKKKFKNADFEKIDIDYS